jgi:hypothetical protein
VSPVRVYTWGNLTIYYSFCPLKGAYGSHIVIPIGHTKTFPKVVPFSNGRNNNASTTSITRFSILTLTKTIKKHNTQYEQHSASSFIMLSVVMLSGVFCTVMLSRYIESRSTECRYAGCRYSKCRYDERHYVECRGAATTECS